MKKITALILVAGMSLSMAACGAKNEPEATSAAAEVKAESVAAVSVTATPEPTEAVAASATSEEEVKLIGEKLEGENVYEVVLTNATGKAIKGFSIKDGSLEEYPENMMASEDVFADGEQRALYYDTTEAMKAVEDASAESDTDAPLANPEYSVELTFDDDSTAELHVFPVEETKDVVIKLEDDIVFLEYVSAETQDTVSTKEAELAVKQAEAGTLEADEQSDASTDTATETQTYDAPAQTYEEPTYQEPAYQEPVYEEPAYVPEAPAGGDDGCLDDGLTWD